MDNKKSSGNGSIFGGIRDFTLRESERRRGERGALFYDIAVIATAFFFARRHFVFGAYPLASAFVAVLPSRVWCALLGSLVGALTLGRGGVIFAVNSLIIVFLRIILSGGGELYDGKVFN